MIITKRVKDKKKEEKKRGKKENHFNKLSIIVTLIIFSLSLIGFLLSLQRRFLFELSVFREFSLQ